MRTYRFRGHSMSDPAKYRTQAELEEHKQRDPLLRARKRTLEDGLRRGALEALEKSVEAEVADAVKFAHDSPEPGLERARGRDLQRPVRLVRDRPEQF